MKGMSSCAWSIWTAGKFVVVPVGLKDSQLTTFPSSLDSIAKKIGPIRIDVLGKISEAVVEGLNYLYNVHRILHRDVKPSNILVNSRGSIKLCDFGVSGELINSIADTFVGTSTYMSPERIKGAKYSVKSDVWSLGLSLLELAIGRFPFDADGTSAGTRASAGPMGILDLLQKIVNEPAPKLPKNKAFPPSLEKMIEHCLIKDPEKRPSPQELLVSLPHHTILSRVLTPNRKSLLCARQNPQTLILKLGHTQSSISL